MTFYDCISRQECVKTTSYAIRHLLDRFVYFREKTWWDNSEVIGGGKGKSLENKEKGGER